MNKFFFFIILFGLAGAAGLGILSNTFVLVLQELGVFHAADVILAGCVCVDESGPVECDPEVITNPLCPFIIPP